LKSNRSLFTIQPVCSSFPEKSKNWLIAAEDKPHWIQSAFAHKFRSEDLNEGSPIIPVASTYNAKFVARSWKVKVSSRNPKWPIMQRTAVGSKAR